jgi:subtilisin family serine protease
MQGASGRARRNRLGRRLLAPLVALVLLALAAPAAADDVVPAKSVSLFAVEKVDGGLEVRTIEAGSAREAAAVVDVLADEGNVVSVEVDSAVRAFGETYRPVQWALDAVPFESTWPATTGVGVVVAVLDTGVYAGHEDLAGAVLRGRDFVGSSYARIDPAGHGTHVAGIVGARLNNRGIAGAAPGVAILPVRVLDANGAGYMSDVAAGTIWAVDHGADVVTMSLGGNEPSDGLHAALRYARRRGVTVLAAAGNSALSGNPVIYPAAYPEVIAVGAVDRALQRAPFSGYRGYVDLVAPGVSIRSTWNEGAASYVDATGTSMATPFAAAAAALVKAIDPRATPAMVEQTLAATARDLGPAGRDPWYGHGLVDPRAAVVQARAMRTSAGGKGSGYWIVSADGRVRAYGAARHRGDLAGRALPAPIVAAARTPSGRGYWLAGASGRVYAFGDARRFGDMTGRRLNGAVVGMAPTPSGRGYYLLGSDGGVFSFGDAKFFGSTGALALRAPVVDMSTTRTGRGYWLVASDGGIFSFGDAVFRGSTGAIRLAQPVRSMTANVGRAGYWLVARDGGTFTFGVPYRGSLPGVGLQTASAVRIRALPDGSGYYVLTANGAVYPFGRAARHGSAMPLPPWTPAVDLMLAP